MNELTADYAGKRHVIMRLGKLLGGGASGDIYRIVRRPGIVAKIYRSAADQQRYEAKIEDMIRRRPTLEPISFMGKEYPQIAWPVATLRNQSGAFVGFVMPEIDLKLATELENVLQRTARKSLGLPEFYGGRLLLAANLAALMAELHKLAHYFIDMKPMNLRFYPNAWYLAIIDTDGFSIQGSQRWPAHQYSQEYIAPEAQNLSPTQLGVEQDLFALAVIIFRLLNNGLHPYQGIDSRANLPTSLQERIFSGIYSYGQKASLEAQPSRASTHEYLEPTTRVLFDRAFSGHPASRPTAREWSNHLRALITDKVFVKCSIRPDEHGHFSKGCGLCALDVTRRQAASPRSQSSLQGGQMSGAAIGAPAYMPPARASSSPSRTQSSLRSFAPQSVTQAQTPVAQAQTPPKGGQSSAGKWIAIAFGALILLGIILNNKDSSSPSSTTATSTSRPAPTSTAAPSSRPATPSTAQGSSGGTSLVNAESEALCLAALSSNVLTATTMQEITWDPRPQFSPHIAEVQRRGLTIRSCAAFMRKPLPPDQPTGVQSARAGSQMPTVSDRDVCKTALNASQTAWDSRLDFQPYKKEAEQRGFSVWQCQQLVVSPDLSSAGSVTQRPGSSMPTVADRDVCRTALNASKTQWDTRADFQTYIQEAERRRLTIQQCQQLIASPGSAAAGRPNQRLGSTMPTVTDGDVCRAALNASKTQWDTRDDFQTYIQEAERRRLTIQQCQQLLVLRQ